MPWLWLAEKYHADGDQRRSDDAFEKASKTKRIETYGLELYRLTQKSLLPGTTPLEKFLIWEDLEEVDSIEPISGREMIDDACSSEAVINDLRRTQCSALVRLLVDQRESIWNVAAGVKIGERIGWPKSKVDKIKQKSLVLSSIALRERDGVTELNKNDLNVKFDCQMMERSDKYFENLGKLGEVGAAEYYVGKSGGG